MKPKISCTKIGVDSYAIYIRFRGKDVKIKQHDGFELSNYVTCVLDEGDRGDPIGLEILYCRPRRKS